VDIISRFQRSVGAYDNIIGAKGTGSATEKYAGDYVPVAGEGVAGSGDIEVEGIRGFECRQIVPVIFDRPAASEPGINLASTITGGIVVYGSVRQHVHLSCNHDE